jgi:putative ABC transport system permease protein
MSIFSLAWHSLNKRRLTATLAVIALALSVTLFLGVERLRISAKESFTNTISGTDLIVGARAGNVQLLLYSVFRMGNATSNISMESLERIAARDEVAWVVPISLGDSHKSYRVMGTTNDYFEHYRYRNKSALEFAAGQRFDDLFDVVIGSEAAKNLGYRLGSEIIISHGIDAIGSQDHDTMPFKITGILERTGTPVDRTIHVSLEALEAVHLGWQADSRALSRKVTSEQARAMRLAPSAVTAALVGTKSRFGIFKVQRYINNFKGEPLTAVLPGVALQELWSLVSIAETALATVSSMVVLTAILGMVTMILGTLNERRQEIAILRSIGAHPSTIFSLLMIEAVILALGGIVLGTALLYLLLMTLSQWVEQSFGLYLAIGLPTLYEIKLMLAILVIACLVGAIPAMRAYRQSLSDGMSVNR